MSNTLLSLTCSITGLAMAAVGQPAIGGFYAMLGIGWAVLEWRRAR